LILRPLRYDAFVASPPFYFLQLTQRSTANVQQPPIGFAAADVAASAITHAEAFRGDVPVQTKEAQDAL
jgi:hypothetical protein